MLRLLLVFSVLLSVVVPAGAACDYWCQEEVDEEVDAPVVETLDATGIMGASATLNGNLVELGTAGGALQVWFDWWVGSNDTAYQETPRQKVTSTGMFSAQIIDITSGTTYSFRAVAYRSTYNLYVYGSTETFYVP